MDVRDWADPEPRASVGAARGVAEALREKPREWAVIEEFQLPVLPVGADPEQTAAWADAVKKIRAKASSRASLIKQARVSAFRSQVEGLPGTFEARSCTKVLDPDNPEVKVIKVFARYVGEEFAAPLVPRAPRVPKVPADGSGPASVPADDLVNV